MLHIMYDRFTFFSPQRYITFQVKEIVPVCYKFRYYLFPFLIQSFWENLQTIPLRRSWTGRYQQLSGVEVTEKPKETQKMAPYLVLMLQSEPSSWFDKEVQSHWV